MTTPNTAQEKEAVDTEEQPDNNKASPADSSPFDFDEPVYDDEEDLAPVSEGSVNEGDPDEEDGEEKPASEAPEAEQEQAAEPDTVTPEEEAPDEELVEMLKTFDLDPDVFEPAIVDAFTGIKKVVEKQAATEKRLLAELAAVKQEVGSKKQDEWFDTFDRHVSDLAIDDFGTTTRDKLSKTQFQARSELLAEMNVITKGREAANLDALPLPALITKAIGSLGKSPTKSPAPAKPAPIVNRPGRQPGTDNLSPEQRAIRNLRRKINEYDADAELAPHFE